MPIRINLLAEAQAAEELRRRDPVKRGIWIAGFLVSLVLLWSLTLQSRILIANARLNGLNSKWAGIEKVYHQVMENRGKEKQAEQKLAALEQLSTNRFLWASFLNVLQQCAMDEVRLLRVKGEQTYFSNENTPDKASDTKVARSKTPTATERISIVLEARDHSANTAGHTKLKETLANSALFQSFVQKTNVLLDGLSAPGPDPASPSGVTANFALKCFFPEKERSLK